MSLSPAEPDTSEATWCSSSSIQARTSSSSTICRPGSAGRFPPTPRSSSAMSATRSSSARIIRKHGIEFDHPFRRLDRRAGVGRRSARLLPQQHRQVARPDGGRGRDGHQELHLLLDGRRLRHAEGEPGARGRRADADVALRLLQADDRDHARRHRRARTISATWRCAISTSPAPTPRAARASRRRRRRTCIKVACETALGKRAYDGGVRHRLRRRRTAPASATTSTSPTWRARTWRRCATCATAASPTCSTAATRRATRCCR